MKRNRGNSERALTLIEVLVVVVVIALVIWMLLPKMDRHKASATRTQCISNLKQIGMGFRQWATYHDSQFPMEISVTDGGTKEFIERGGASVHFLVLADEINTPKILVCPTDKARWQALSFTNGLSDTNVSYFVGVDAVSTNPPAFLSGDRNITNGTPPPNRILALTSNSAVGWTKEMHKAQGNVGWGDGSVQAFSSTKLREALSYTGFATNRLAMPLD